MKTDIFHLQVIPVKNILPHEQFDINRAHPLVERLKKEQMQVNPILVAEIEEGQYLQLDGMNRLSAFSIMGISSILAQIIDYNDRESVELASWMHLFGGTIEEFVASIRTLPNATVEADDSVQIRSRFIESDGDEKIAKIVDDKGNSYLVSCSGTLADKLAVLNGVVSHYADRISRDVLSGALGTDEQLNMFAAHPGTNIMVAFPTFARHQVVKAVRQQALFPSGITRFIIQRRCLNVNIPLSLMQKGTTDEQNVELETFLTKRNYRVYEEPTVYFE